MRLRHRKRVTTLQGLVEAAGFLTALFSIATVFNQLHQYLELFSHFRLQYLGVASILLILYLLLRSWRYVALMIVTVGLNAWYVTPWYLPAASPSHGEGSLKIVMANLHADNSNHIALSALLQKEKPDLVVLQEISRSWALTLETFDEFPHRRIVPRVDYFGIAVISRLPFDWIDTIASPPRGFPTITAQLRVDEQLLTIVATHPMPPMTKVNYDARNVQLADIAELINAIDGPHALIGDLNTTMWGDNYRRLVTTTGLENVRRGFGVLPTWPTFLPFAMIPIDHCLVSDDLRVVDVRLGSNIGSDHRPLIVTLAVR